MISATVRQRMLKYLYASHVSAYRCVNDPLSLLYTDNSNDFCINTHIGLLVCRPHVKTPPYLYESLFVGVFHVFREHLHTWRLGQRRFRELVVMDFRNASLIYCKCD